MSESNRTTLKMLQSRVDYLNKVTDSPATYSDKSAPSFKSNHGHYYIGQQYGGVSLDRVHGEGGGCEAIFHTTTKRDLLLLVSAYIRGIESSKFEEVA